jgi:hypothetical protein
MRPARVLFVAAFAIVSLAAVVSAGAVRGPMEEGTLSVRDGRATIVLRIKGGVIGRLAKGRLTITDSPAGGGLVVVRGAERVRNITERTTIYSGTNIRFRVSDDRRFVLRVNGTKINFSAVGRGDGWLDGFGDPDRGIYFDGSYSLNGEPYSSIPDLRERFELASTPSGR